MDDRCGETDQRADLGGVNDVFLHQRLYVVQAALLGVGIV